MKARRYTTSLALALAGILLAAACVDESVDAEYDTPIDNDTMEQALEAIADELGISLDGSLGTLDDSDEEPAFGSAELAEAFGGEDEDEAPPQDEVVTNAPPGARMFTIMAIWGRIQRDDGVEPRALRWDPVITVTGGAVRVIRTLRFERSDHLEPQTVPNQVAAISWTRPHVDGLLLQVAIDPDTVEASDLRFQSEPLQILVPAIQLVGLDQTHLIDDAGNGLLLVALEQSVDRCAYGFLGGRWARTGDRHGVFGGRWQSETGSGAGFLAGRWGVTEAGRQVFHGKVINEAGEFLGLLSGTWGDGTFQGQLYGTDGNVRGTLRGQTTGEDGHGLFRGAWRADCDGPGRSSD